MVFNKENLVFILDVRQTNDDSFIQKSMKCCADVIKQKICSGRKDEISFILVGTECTRNSLSTDSNEGYANIYQYTTNDNGNNDNNDDDVECVLHLPTWQLLMNFYQCINEKTTCKSGDWLDALVVAMNLIKQAGQRSKIKHSRIVLFYNFSIGQCAYEDYDILTESLLKNEIDLIVVSPDIGYIDNKEDEDQPRVVFKPNPTKSKHHVENEKYALNLVASCNAQLCNFTEALSTIQKVKNKRPWTWNCQLRIGTQISIAVCGIIKAKNEKTIKLCTMWKENDEKLTREWGYFLDGNQIAPDEDDLMNGYMLGGTAIPYDEANNIDETLKLPKGLTFMGFIPRHLVYEEYFNGDSTYLILHQRGMTSSAQKLDALARVLLKQDRAILCWKVYSEKLNKPKVVVLIPNPPHTDCPATFNMIEMAHHAQYHFFEFPKLTTKNTECSSEQLNAIDNLIDSMDLTFSSKSDESKTRETAEKDYLPIDNLVNIFEYNFMNVIERKIICKASESDAMFEELLEDKNFVEKFWKLPEPIEEQAKEAIKIVKEKFPLHVDTEWLKKLELNRKDKTMPLRIHKNNSTEDSGICTSIVPLDMNTLNWTNPAKDFESLLKCNVFSIKDYSERDCEFERLSIVYCDILKKLIFKKNDKNQHINDIVEGIRVLRKHCYDFNAFNLYNDWITHIKNEVIREQHFDFWQDVIVRNSLGLCFIGVLSKEEANKMKDFYII